MVTWLYYYVRVDKGDLDNVIDSEIDKFLTGKMVISAESMYACYIVHRVKWTVIN